VDELTIAQLLSHDELVQLLSVAAQARVYIDLVVEEEAARPGTELLQSTGALNRSDGSRRQGNLVDREIAHPNLEMQPILPAHFRSSMKRRKNEVLDAEGIRKASVSPIMPYVLVKRERIWAAASLGLHRSRWRPTVATRLQYLH
jgi:hypothetical protein